MAKLANALKKGIKAFHGTPHSFDAFDFSKIGTGEGAQAYGHGLYFSDSEGIAKGYRDRLSSNYAMEKDGNPTPWGTYWGEVNSAAQTPGTHPDQAYQVSKMLTDLNHDQGLSVDQIAQEYDPPQGFETQWGAALEAARPYKKAKTPGKMYEVNIDANPESFLDWDKPLSEQPEVQARLANIGEASRSSTTKGADKYISLENMFGAIDWPDNADAAVRAQYRKGAAARVSEKLKEAGIPGIKYLANDGSRAAGEGAHNYVVFDDKLVSIVRKYGIAGASAMLGYNVLDGMSDAQAAELQKQAYPTDTKEANTRSLANFLKDRGAVATQGASAMFDGEKQRPKTAKDQLADIGTQAVAGINRGVAALPGLPKDLAGLADWGLDAAGVSDNEILRNVINPGRMWPVSGEDSIKAWEDFAGKLPEAETSLGTATDFLGQLVSPGPGELAGGMAMAGAIPAAGKKLTADLVKKSKPVKATFADQMKAVGVTSERDMKEIAKGYGNATAMHPKEWEYEYRDLGNIQRPPGVFDPEKAVRDRATFMQLYGDKSSAGRELLSVNGKKLKDAVKQQGGNEFIYGPNGRAAVPAGWASLPGAVTTLGKRAMSAPKDGPLFGVFSAMGSEGIDFSTMPLKTVLGLLSGNSVSSLADVDAAVKNLMKPKVSAKYPGLTMPEGRAALLSNADGMGSARSQIMKVLDTSAWKNTGLPDIAPLRWANTDPGLVDVPNGMTGRSITRLDPEGRRVLDVPDPHETYPHKLGGTPEPGYDMDVPPDIWWSDTYRPRLKALGIEKLGEKQLPSTELRLLLTNDLKQPATQQWLDTLMGWRRGVEEGKIRPLTGPRAKPLKGKN